MYKTTFKSYKLHIVKKQETLTDINQFPSRRIKLL